MRVPSHSFNLKGPCFIYRHIDTSDVLCSVTGLKARLEEAIPGSLVAFATAYYIQGNPYDYAGIAGCGVLLVPMTYCDVWVYNSTATKIPSQLYAGACNPLPSLRNELTAYLAAGIPACQIAPILPWFGNRVDCLHPVGEPYTGGNGCMLGPKGGTGSGAGYANCSINANCFGALPLKTQR